MTALTEFELADMLRLVKRRREESLAIRNYPGQPFAALYQMDYENMAALAEKLEAVISSGCRRVEVKRWTKSS